MDMVLLRTYEHMLYRLLHESVHPYASMHIGKNLAVSPFATVGANCTYVNPMGVAYRIAETHLQQPFRLKSKAVTNNAVIRYIDYRNKKPTTHPCVVTGFESRDSLFPIEESQYMPILREVFGLDQPFWDDVEVIRDKYVKTDDCAGCFAEILDLLRKILPSTNAQSLDDVYWDQT